MNLAVIVPSRGRPQNVAELLDAWHATTGPDAHLHVMIDDDDPTRDGVPWTRASGSATIWLGARRRLGGSLNYLAPILARSVDIVGFMGDDHRPRTPGWDERIAATVEATPGAVVYGNDLNQGERLPTAVFMDARIVRAQGFMIPPGMVHLYLDDYWKLLGQRLGTLRYLPDVVIEHLHPTVGKAEWDDGYREVNAAELYASDKERFEAYVREQMDDDIDVVHAWLYGRPVAS